MDDLIEALRIFRKYDNSKYPTSCEYEMLYVGVDPRDVSTEDKNLLQELGFYPGEEDEPYFTSSNN